MHTTGGVIVLSDHDSASSSYELFKFAFLCDFCSRSRFVLEINER